MCSLHMRIYRCHNSVYCLQKNAESLETTVHLQAVLYFKQYCIVVQSMCSSGVLTIYGGVNKVSRFILASIIINYSVSMVRESL